MYQNVLTLCQVYLPYCSPLRSDVLLYLVVHSAGKFRDESDALLEIITRGHDTEHVRPHRVVDDAAIVEQAAAFIIVYTELVRDLNAFRYSSYDASLEIATSEE